LTRAFHAFKDTATPVRIAAVGFAFNLSLSLWLMRSHGTLGLALASNTAIVVQTVLLQLAMSRGRSGFGFQSLAVVVLRQVVAAVVMGLALWFSLQGLNRFMEPHPVSMVAVFILIPASVIVYFGILWLIGTDERELITAFLNRISGRGNRNGPVA